MKALTTLEIIIIIVILIVTALFVLSWLGIGSNPLDWFKKESIKSTFCSEIVSRTNCQMIEVSRVEELGISSLDKSSKIKNKEIGKPFPEEYAKYGDVCTYLGYGDLRDCLVKLCGCKIK